MLSPLTNILFRFYSVNITVDHLISPVNIYFDILSLDFQIKKTGTTYEISGGMHKGSVGEGVMVYLPVG
jgi:hypothetical protein